MRQPKEMSTAFHLLTRPTNEDIYKHIAEQTNVPLGHVYPHELQELLHLFLYAGSMPVDNPLVRKYLGNDKYSTQRWQVVTQGAESLSGTFPLAMSYGIFLPSYYKELQEQRDRVAEQPAQHTSLLIGALTADTVREYATTVRDVHPDANCQVIDITGGKKAEALPEAVTFNIGSGLRLPFSDGSVNSVHTNFLLGHLEDRRRHTNQGRQRKLFEEAARVLDKDGVLLMVEEAVSPKVLSNLQSAGFTGVNIKAPEMFIDRRAMESFLRSTAHTPLPGTTGEVDSSSASLVVARKLPATLR